jgi:hypothetical protein
MEQYFFNARKNNITGKMDYAAMAETESQLAANMNLKSSHRLTGTPNLLWKPLGPSNVGGRTRAIVVDNQDPTGNTLFAAAVSGGIWKSTNGGATWDSINDRMGSLEACDLAEDASGNIYCGTGEGFSLYVEGEGFSTGLLGNGIYKSNNHGKSFYHIPSTTPSATNSDLATWAYTNRIAISPCNPQFIYAATNLGLYVTSDTGIRWANMWNFVTNKKINGSGVDNCLDVKMSTDGSVVVADVNGVGYIKYPVCGSLEDTMFTPIKSTGAGKLATSPGGRIEFAISPTNANYIYASVVNNAGVLIGVYASLNKGAYWYDIGPGGSMTFNPYTVGGGGSDQGTYDNTLAVSPANSGELLLGGTTLWSWKQRFASDSVGVWTSISTYFGSSYFPSPVYIHPDEHAITFDPNHPNTVYVGCDGGVYKSIDGGTTWTPMDRDYNVTQFYSLAFSAYVNPTNGEGVIGGTQDNGSPYVNGLLYHWQDAAANLGGGDGSGVGISYINPNIFFSGDHYLNSLSRGSNLAGPAYPSSFFTSTEGLEKGANFDSIAAASAAANLTCFVPPIALYENLYDPYTVDSIIWIADSSYGSGHIVYPLSPNGGVPFAYTLTAPVAKGDTIKVKNTVVSKVATGLGASEYVWMTMQAADLSDAVIWMPIGGPLSKPDGFTGGDPIHCMAWSPDGDALFVGTEGGQLFRFSNLDSIRDTSYMTGAVFSIKKGSAATYVPNPMCKVISRNMGNMFSGRDILSISVNPYDGNQIIVTLGNYGHTNQYVYYCDSALKPTLNAFTFAQKQGTGVTALPNMPVYCSVLGLFNGGPNSALVGTEHGVYYTKDITVANPVWDTAYTGAPNTLVIAMQQQTLPSWLCNNSGDVYMGTHGRGAWYTGSLGPVPTSVQNISPADKTASLKVYPNPMSTQGTVDYTLAAEDNITLTIYDIQGREIQNISLGKQGQGEHLVPINTEHLSNGTYLVTVTGSNFRKTARIVVVN